MQFVIEGHLEFDLRQLKRKIENRKKCSVSWANVIADMIEKLLLIPKLEEKIRELSLEICRLNKNTEKFLELSLSHPAMPMMAVQQNLPSIPKPPSLPYHPPPNTADVKKDYQNEIKQVFNGTDIISPSQVMSLTQPKHKDALIKEIDEEKPLNSFVEKNIEHFKEEKKDGDNVL